MNDNTKEDDHDSVFSDDNSEGRDSLKLRKMTPEERYHHKIS